VSCETMASDVTLDLLDREGVVTQACDQDTSMDQLLITTAITCHISPVARGLFAFKQAGRWVSPSQVVSGGVNTEGGVSSPLQLRLRYKMPDWKARDRPSNLKIVDPKAFQYFYYQVRRDFDSGLVCNKKVAGEKDQKWWLPIIQPGAKDKREDRLIELNINMLELVGRNMAIDVMDERIDRKEVVKNVKSYIPRDLYSGLEKIMAVNMLQRNVEGYVDKLLKAYQPTMSSMQLKDDFLKLTEKFFPIYFCESFPAQCDEGGRVCEVRLVVSPPEEDKQVTLTMVRRGEADKSTVIATIDQICNIAVQDSTSVEISRKNGVPLYFKLLSPCDTNSLLALLCGYYRLAEKWTFSLCTELRFPVLELLTASKVHGPVSREFAEEKLKKHNFKKGSFLIRQCVVDHHKLYLHFCSRDGCKPDEVAILEERGLFSLQGSITKRLPMQLREQFRTVSELVLAIRTVPSPIELANCSHPSEFDRTMSLLLCRTDCQWREDSLGNKMSQGQEKVHIQPRSLSRYEKTLAKGRMCSVWQGVWHRSAQETRTVAIKQLHKSLLGSHLLQFLSLAHRSLMWDDGSLCSVAGFVLPCGDEPPVLVTEYFKLGPLPAYLASNKSILQPVDLLEAATCLARALYYLEDSRIVHGEIRARNIFVALHSDTQFKVKLCEGGLEGPSREDVHWLDFQQLQSVVTSEMLGTSTAVLPTLTGDVWSFGSTLWEIFSMGQVPLPGVAWQDAASQYIAGYRLPWPGPTQLATPLYNIMHDCWQPVQGQRKQPQAIMRDINQLLYKVFNSRRIHDYVTIDVGPPSPSTPATLTPQHSVSVSTRSSLSMDLGSPPVTSGLVPMFTDISRKLLENHHNFSEFGSSSPLIAPGGCSRSGSSLAGSLFNTDMSAITCQTSLDWGSLGGGGGLYSISSIYQLEDSQIEYTTDFPLGEGNFGVVYKGVRTRSDGDWEQVAIKMIKDTDTMSNSAHDDMEREVSLMKKLSHENIVKIKGVLTDGPNTIIVMEFIREGSLDRYLQVNRHNLDYPKQLFGYSQNIVDGMEYLTHNKIIHRDLAARNILVADQETVKISDFGLARVATNDLYVMHSTTNIPVRWEAIECLTHRKYSHKSDVWSFGVTLWEMFAFGATPALSGCQDFFTSYQRQRQDFRDWLTKLEEGVRLPQTELCPNFLYSRVMLACWQKDPQARPTFLQLKHTIKKAELEVT